MIDFNGNKLSVGDTVIFVRKGYREYSLGVITGFTEKFVKLKHMKKKDENLYGILLRQAPEQLIKTDFNEHHRKGWFLDEKILGIRQR